MRHPGLGGMWKGLRRLRQETNEDLQAIAVRAGS